MKSVTLDIFQNFPCQSPLVNCPENVGVSPCDNRKWESGAMLNEDAN